MGKLFGRGHQDQERELVERHKRAQDELESAQKDHTRKAIDSTIKADGAASAIDALLDRMDQEKKRSVP